MLDDPKNEENGADSEAEDVEIPDFDDVHDFELPPKKGDSDNDKNDKS